MFFCVFWVSFFFRAQLSFYELTSWRRESVEGAGEGCLSKAISCLEPMGSGCEREGNPAASAGTSPRRGIKGGEREREVWGEGTRIITPAGLIAINIKNQINMSRCVFHFFAYTRRVNEKRGERERGRKS